MALWAVSDIKPQFRAKPKIILLLPEADDAVVIKILLVPNMDNKGLIIS